MHTPHRHLRLVPREQSWLEEQFERSKANILARSDADLSLVAKELKRLIQER